jgi:hypothetical protein
MMEYMEKPVHPSTKFVPNRYDVMNRLPAAGLIPKGDQESTHQCLNYGNALEKNRPPTPENIKKYRKSFQNQPGLRFLSTGLVDQKLPPSHHRHGVTTMKGDRVGDCFDQVPPSELADFLNEQKESIYLSNIKEPLGASYSRGHVFPNVVNDADFRFGTTTKTSESSKGLIYYNETIPDRRAYSLSGAPAAAPDSSMNIERDITRQINREYNWQSPGIDPNTHRFGKIQPLQMNGVADALKRDDDTKIGSKRVNQVRAATHDRLGKQRELRGVLRQFGEDFVFGRNNVPDEWGAKKTIQGNYTPGEQMPDRDLGVSTRRLDNLSFIPDNHANRVFGVPSIRNDLPAPHLKSVADGNNYGDEVNAKGLLYPSTFAFDGVSQEDFLQVRPPEEIRELFKRVGAEFSDSQFDRLCSMASSQFGALSADSFRHAWNKTKFEQEQAAQQ